MANICQALKGQKFLMMADVASPVQIGADQSSATRFRFRVNGSTPANNENTTEAPTAMNDPTNLILYGPPGTGKTYETAREAVRLCGEAVPDGRTELMAAYKRLRDAGRIEFITFHQSVAYEDFVEGLRPSTKGDQDNEDDPNLSTTGFNLRPHVGVFKRISEKARLDSGDAAITRLDRSKAIYKVALGRRSSQEDQIRRSLDKSLIHLGWGADIDWSDDKFDDFEEIRKHWNSEKNADASGKDPNIEMTYAFRAGLQVDDYVVVSDGRDSYRAFGRVTSEYQFNRDETHHPHQRSVEWIWRDDAGAKRAEFYGRNFRRQAIYRLDPEEIDWDALEAQVLRPDAQRPFSGARPHVLIIDEINRANISKVFGELITLLEADKRLGADNELTVSLPYSGATFGVPANLHVIGTMNTADRSIALLDTALRRRFEFRELMPDPTTLSEVDGIDLRKLLSALNERIEYLFDREHQIGHAYFIGCSSRQHVDAVMRHKVIPLLAEYFYEDWSKVAAVLGDATESEGSREGRFIDRVRLQPPKGMSQDEDSSARYRWKVRDAFSYEEFAAP